MLVIEYARRSLGFTQREVAVLARMHQHIISLAERGQFLPDHDQRQRLAKALHVAPDDLLKDAPSLPAAPMAPADHVEV